MCIRDRGWHLLARSYGYADLQVINKRDGYFQIKGLGKEFLESLAAELEEYRETGIEVSDEPAAFAEEPLE